MKSSMKTDTDLALPPCLMAIFPSGLSSSSWTSRMSSGLMPYFPATGGHKKKSFINIQDRISLYQARILSVWEFFLINILFQLCQENGEFDVKLSQEGANSLDCDSAVFDSIYSIVSQRQFVKWKAEVIEKETTWSNLRTEFINTQKKTNKHAQSSRAGKQSVTHVYGDLTRFGHRHPVDVHQQPGTEQHHMCVLNLRHDDLTGHLLVAAPTVSHAELGGECPEHRHANAVPGTLHPRVTQSHHLTNKQTSALLNATMGARSMQQFDIQKPRCSYLLLTKNRQIILHWI